ncbi:hypothetical protein QYF36_024349 [Acer negundo]|nr:hypothetical protein QYF36_024349 [Acer negundo]
MYTPRGSNALAVSDRAKEGAASADHHSIHSPAAAEHNANPSLSEYPSLKQYPGSALDPTKVRILTRIHPWIINPN